MFSSDSHSRQLNVTHFLCPVSFSRDSEEEPRERRVRRRADSSEEDPRERRRRLALKRRKASEDDDSSDESSEEEDRPVRKRVNRIDSDDSDEEAEEKPKEKKADEESKGANTADGNPAELPPTNGQSQPKSLEAHAGRPAAAMAPNGLVGQDVAAQDDDEDDLLGVTDLVDYVCNNEDL